MIKQSRLKGRPRQASIWAAVEVRVADGRKASVPVHLIPQVRADLATQGFELPLTHHERRQGDGR